MVLLAGTYSHEADNWSVTGVCCAGRIISARALDAGLDSPFLVILAEAGIKRLSPYLHHPAFVSLH